MAFSIWLANIVLDCSFGKIWYPPHELWIGLSRADPKADESGLDEPDGTGGYARVQTIPSDWLNTYQGLVHNKNVVTFPTATASWGQIKFFTLFDAWLMLLYGELDPYVSVSPGQKPRFNATRIQITLD